MEQYLAARRLLWVGLGAIAALEFAGLTVERSGGQSKVYEVGPLALIIGHPESIVFLLVFFVAYGYYRYLIEWHCLEEASRSLAPRALDHRVTIVATSWLLFAFYATEAVRRWREGWVPHALAVGIVAAGLLLSILFKSHAEKLLAGAAPQLRRAQQIVIVTTMVLLVAEPFAHNLPALHWLAVVSIPSIFLLNVALQLGVRPRVVISNADAPFAKNRE